MNADRWTARVVGILLLIAMVSSLTGGVLLEAILAERGDPTHLSTQRVLMAIGVALEFVNAIAVIGIAVA